MFESAEKADLCRYLQEARDALLWKVDGLSEYNARRPMTPTGTNLLGLVKHLAFVEMAYFGDSFDRPCENQIVWNENDPNSDMFAAASESRDFITGLYRQAWAHADATFNALPLDAVGRVPWWPLDKNEATLHHLMVRVTTETWRHAGHADIIRELIDGAAGETTGKSNLPSNDPEWWKKHRDRVEQVARESAANVGEHTCLQRQHRQPPTRRRKPAPDRTPAAGHLSRRR